MEKSDYVSLMQKYIEEHIDEKISLSDLSYLTGYSPWHCYRIFEDCLGVSVSTYVRRLKLAKSALELRDDPKKVIDIAFKYGFDSVDGYQRAFLKEFGTNPKEYTKKPSPIYLFTPYPAYNAKEKKIIMPSPTTVFVSLITKPKRKALIKRGIKANHYFDYCAEVGCDIWGLLTSMKSLSGEPVSMWLPKKFIKEGTSTYVQGVEVPCDFDGVIPEGFDVIELPEAEYLMFVGEPFKEEDFESAIMNVWDAMKKYNPVVLNKAWDDDNPRIQLAPIGERGYIEFKAVKSI